MDVIGSTETKWIVEISLRENSPWFAPMEYDTEEEAMERIATGCENLEGDVHKKCIGNMMRAKKVTETIIAIATAE